MDEVVEKLRVFRVEATLKEPFFERDGNLFFDPAVAGWTVLPVKSSEEQCDHFDSLCAECARAWLTDHYVRIVHVECGEIRGINNVPGLKSMMQD